MPDGNSFRFASLPLFFHSNSGVLRKGGGIRNTRPRAEYTKNGPFSTFQQGQGNGCTTAYCPWWDAASDPASRCDHSDSVLRSQARMSNVSRPSLLREGTKDCARRGAKEDEIPFVELGHMLLCFCMVAIIEGFRYTKERVRIHACGSSNGPIESLLQALQAAWVMAHVDLHRTSM